MAVGQEADGRRQTADRTSNVIGPQAGATMDHGNGFASKEIRFVNFGFAAGCEAVALPRRGGALYIFGALPLVRPLPNKSRGLSPDQGHSPGIIWLLTAGQSQRLTSGGKAEPPTQDV